MDPSPYPSGIVSYDSTNNRGVAYSTSTGLDGDIYDVYMRGILPSTYYSNCIYYYKPFSLAFKYEQMTAPSLASMPSISYGVGNPI